MFLNRTHVHPKNNVDDQVMHSTMRTWHDKHVVKIERIIAFAIDRSPWYDSNKHLILVEFHRVKEGYDFESAHVMPLTSLQKRNIPLSLAYCDPKSCFYLLQVKGYRDTDNDSFVGHYRKSSGTIARLKVNPPEEAEMHTFVHDTFVY